MLYQFSNTLTDIDSKKHLPFPFEVAEGTTRIEVCFDFSPKNNPGMPGDNNLSLSLFDPLGARGAGHCRPDNNFTISAADATPGYVPGALPPGVWTLMIDTHMVLPGPPVSYTLEISATDEPLTASTPHYMPGDTAPRGPSWYRGDLHGHTIHSDGHWDVPDLVNHARACQLDFVTLTDHNTVSGLSQLDSYANDDLLTMGGVELTTFSGHCLALGTRQWLEWRTREGLSMTDIANKVMAANAYFVIAHPNSVGDPVCTGCDWQYPELMPGVAPAVEIWNSQWDGMSGNEQTVQMFYGWLNQGHRLVATSGTDIHGPAQPGEKLGFDIVYADELSESAILEAIRRGHLYISGGPQVSLTGHTASGAQAMMGDTLPAEDTTLEASWAGASATDRVRLIADGAVIEERTNAPEGQVACTLSANQYGWCLIEIRDETGILRAITNPIFLGGSAK